MVKFTNDLTGLGDVFWITGLAGAGKTTVARAFLQRLQNSGSFAILLDGDELRTALARENTHGREERLELALSYARLCRLISSQGATVICSTMSLFPEIWEWNRENVPGYHEIYLKVSSEVLHSRDKKNLYSEALEKKVENVVGMDIHFDEPTSPDLVIQNDGSITPQEAAEKIYLTFLKDKS